jgi:nucleoside-diphosphate-sugar epimerase
MKHVILITGAAGYVGAMLVRRFTSRSDVSLVIGLDKEAKPELLVGIQNLVWIDKNTADEWESEVKKLNPTIVIHAAWQIREMYGKKELQWLWNITGSEKVFDFVFSTPSVKRLVHFSTVASYGAFPDNTIEHLFTENEAFRKTDYLYAEEKRIAEEKLKERYDRAKKSGAPVPQVSIVRPAAITGPRGRYMRIRFGLQAALSGQLKESFIHRLISAMVSFVPVTEKWCRQFIHEDDVVSIVELLAFGDVKGSEYEAFNICPPGDVVRGPDMASAVGKKPIRIHPNLIRIVFFIMWHLSRGKVPTSRGGWKSYSYPIAVDGSKLTRIHGFRYTFSSKDAFVKKEGEYMKFIKA